MTRSFTGSYIEGDVEFLLTPIEIENTPVGEKETLIQTGEKHYSELLTHEKLPAAEYLQLFHDALSANGRQMAEHVVRLAAKIDRMRQGTIVLVSLARAGTPVGVLLKRVLQNRFRRKCVHYSVSIVRDKGIDRVALRYILRRHAPLSLVFVDGWTGKGVIAGQLRESLQAFAASDGIEIPGELFVLADLCGEADVAATTDDYLIPSCILNSTVSGLVSRTLWRAELEIRQSFHGCVYYQAFKAFDLSNFFVCEILRHAEEVANLSICDDDEVSVREALRAQTREFLGKIAHQYRLSHYNYIKPGIGESTRALLRRGAGILLLQQCASPSIRHLKWLAESKRVSVVEYSEMPYCAAVIIKEVR